MDIMNHCITVVLSCLLCGLSCLELVLQGRTLFGFRFCWWDQRYVLDWLLPRKQIYSVETTEHFAHTVVWMDFSFCVSFSTPVGLRNLKVCRYWNIFASGVTFCFSCSRGSAFLPTAAAFFLSSLTLEDASSILSLVIQAFRYLQLWESVPHYCFEYTSSSVFGSWVLLGVRTAWF